MYSYENNKSSEETNPVLNINHSNQIDTAAVH